MRSMVGFLATFLWMALCSAVIGGLSLLALFGGAFAAAAWVGTVAFGAFALYTLED